MMASWLAMSALAAPTLSSCGMSSLSGSVLSMSPGIAQGFFLKKQK